MKLLILPNNWYYTLEDLEYYRFWTKRIIKAGFYFNGWSLPRLLWFISHPLLMPYLYAFIIHDFEYSNKCEYKVTRQQADEFFLYNNIHQYKWWRIVSLLMYIWVRIFGWSHFKKDLPFNKKTLIYKKRKFIY